MYCSTCGTAVSQNLSYCSRCGAMLRLAEGALSLDSLIWAIVSLLVAGVGVIIGLMAVMKNVVGLNEGIIIPATALCFLALLAAEGVLIRILLGTWRGAREAAGPGRPSDQTTRELVEAHPRELTEPGPSITEETTRTFEPVYSRRKSES